MTQPGPKKWIPTPEDLIALEGYHGRGLSKEDCARLIGICPDTLFRRQNEIPEISEAFKKGKAKAAGIIVSKLFKMAEEGNMTAIIFWLKTQLGWKENDPLFQQNNLQINSVIRSKYETMNPDELKALAERAISALQLPPKESA